MKSHIFSCLEFRRFDSGGRHFKKTEREDKIMKNIIKRIVIIAAIAALSAGVTRAYMIQTAAPSGAGKFTAINKSKPGQSRLFLVRY